MSIKLEMLRCFAVVAQTGNLSEASQKLGRTQSAISMTLKQLEVHLGQRLFEGERKNRLTELGEEMLILALNQVRQYDETIRSMETSARAPRGLLRLAAIPSVAALVFPPAIREITNRHPGLRIELRDTDTAQVLDALVQGQADIGVVSGAHRLAGMDARLLLEDGFGLVCAASHPLARQQSAPVLKDLEGAAFVRNSLCDLISLPAFRDAISGSKINVHNTLSLMSMVRTGHWLTVLPASVLHLFPSDLRFRPIAGLNEQRQVFTLLRESSAHWALAREMEGILSGVKVPSEDAVPRAVN